MRCPRAQPPGFRLPGRWGGRSEGTARAGRAEVAGAVRGSRRARGAGGGHRAPRARAPVECTRGFSQVPWNPKFLAGGWGVAPNFCPGPACCLVCTHPARSSASGRLKLFTCLLARDLQRTAVDTLDDARAVFRLEVGVVVACRSLSTRRDRLLRPRYSWSSYKSLRNARQVRKLQIRPQGIPVALLLQLKTLGQSQTAALPCPVRMRNQRS